MHVTARASWVKIHFTRKRITLDLVQRGLIFKDLKLRKEKEGKRKKASYIYSLGHVTCHVLLCLISKAARSEGNLEFPYSGRPKAAIIT
jgi:hypothetical protein